MSDVPRITFTPRPAATPEGEIAVLAEVYSFVLQCGQERRAEKKEEGGPETALNDDAKEINECAAAKDNTR